MTPQPPSRIHAFTDDALGDDDAVGIATRLHAGEVSPPELVEAAIARLESVDPVLAGLAVRDFDRARESAGRAGDSFLAGIPTLVKDNCDVAGLPTQQGSSSYLAHPAPRHGDWAQAFLGTGLVALGKTRLSEFGFNASAEFVDAPPVRNPWDTDHTSGASSAGSAAFVAAGAVPLAHANDGGGSIRIPAACCGLVGLKPSRGRTPGDRMMRRMPVPIIADGVVTRSVRDTAVFLRELEREHRNVRLRPIGDVRRPGRKRLRIGLVLDSLRGNRTDPAVAAVVEDTARLLEELGHRVEPAEVPVPDSFVDDFLVYWSLLAAFLCATGRRTLDPSFDRRRTDDLTRGLARHARRNAHRLPGAIARLRASRERSTRFHREFDAVLSPVVGGPTPELGWLSPEQGYDSLVSRLVEWVAFTPMHNATGDPAVSLPMGTAPDGMPVGVMLGAGCGREARLLELALELEQARPFPRIQDVAGDAALSGGPPAAPGVSDRPGPGRH